MIAKYLYENKYREVQTSFGRTLLIDNYSQSQLQIQTGVLSRLRILEPEEDSKQYYYFDCECEQFQKRAHDNKANGCSYDFLLMAASIIVEQNEADQSMRQALVDAGLLESTGLIKRVVDRQERTENVWDWPWTEKKAHYDALYKDWPRLLKESRYGKPDL